MKLCDDRNVRDRKIVELFQWIVLHMLTFRFELRWTMAQFFFLSNSCLSRFFCIKSYVWILYFISVSTYKIWINSCQQLETFHFNIFNPKWKLQNDRNPIKLNTHKILAISSSSSTSAQNQRIKFSFSKLFSLSSQPEIEKIHLTIFVYLLIKCEKLRERWQFRIASSKICAESSTVQWKTVKTFRKSENLIEFTRFHSNRDYENWVAA